MVIYRAKRNVINILLFSIEFCIFSVKTHILADGRLSKFLKIYLKSIVTYLSFRPKNTFFCFVYGHKTKV